MPIEKVDKYDPDGIISATRPEELAPAYVFMASSDSSLVTSALYDMSGQLSA